MSRASSTLRTLWVLASDWCLIAVESTIAAGRNGWNWFTASTHALHGVAVTRIVLALAILGEAGSNFATRSYSYGATWTGQYMVPATEFVRHPPWSVIWNLAAHPAGLTAIFVVVAASATALLVGFATRTAIVGLLIFWVGLSELTPFTADQSDNLVRISLTMLLLTRCDAVWSVAATIRAKQGRAMRAAPLMISTLHNAGIIALAAQVCFIYAAGGLYKAGGAPWAQGSAIYDPLHVKQFSTWPELANAITSWGPGVALATTLTVLVQATFPVLLLRNWTRRAALIIILGFHIGIGTLMGLPWFSVSALAIDAIFIREETWLRLREGVRSLRATILKGEPNVGKENQHGHAETSEPEPPQGGRPLGAHLRDVQLQRLQRESARSRAKPAREPVGERVGSAHRRILLRSRGASRWRSHQSTEGQDHAQHDPRWPHESAAIDRCASDLSQRQ